MASFRSQLALLRRVLRRVRDKGLLTTLRRAGFLAYEAFHEWKAGVTTDGYIPSRELGLDPDCVDYDPIGYLTIGRALQCLDVKPQQDVFIDIGCGKGRVVVRAAQFPFKRVLGVEVSPELCTAARQNLQRASRKFRAEHVEIVNTDAQEYDLPEDVTAVFLFNPFTGHILEAVVENIRRSLERAPRELTILYVLPVSADDIFARQRWLVKMSERPTQGLRMVVYRAGYRHA